MPEEQRELFDSGAEAAPSRGAPDLALEYLPAWVDRATADAWFETLRKETSWSQEHMKMYGRAVPIPRLTAWYGDPGRAYTYSGILMEPLPWTPLLDEIRAQAEAAAGVSFDSVLLNFYRDGSDSVSWHADDEPELGEAPTIASVSLGAVRTFQLKHRTNKDVERVDLELAHGSLVVMRPPTQAHWLHQVPKRLGKRGPGERINLTFRSIEPPPDAPR